MALISMDDVDAPELSRTVSCRALLSEAKILGEKKWESRTFKVKEGM